MNNQSLNAKQDVKNVSFVSLEQAISDDKNDILSGFMEEQKTINAKYFYDHRGSVLFEKITELPEYYLTRTEKLIMKKHADEMAEVCGDGCVLIEPGSGSSEKVRILLDHLQPQSYVPIDVSGDFLEMSAKKLGSEYPWINIDAICADFSQSLIYSDNIPVGRRVFFYPGSTIGNMNPQDAVAFLKLLNDSIKQGGGEGGILIGIDLVKPASLLNSAYNDSQGVTAEFNLNVLNNINTLAHATFNTNNFSHLAQFNEEKSRIEMHLISHCNHSVRVGESLVSFKEGERIHTENSYKYTLSDIGRLAEQAELKVQRTWTDEDSLFSVHYLIPR
ncbi:L-histidine N(alpha)-methyltransferase [Vibrio profundum]|uniref:L-histidine N(alpha)-methyltransferase n=1 Tax=Vibrio profundum TaxID=2910247 RepID=UPI003D0D2EAD